MHSTSFRTLPLVAALPFSGGLALAQSSYGTGSSAAGGRASSAAQTDTGTGKAESNKDGQKDGQLSSSDRKFMQDAAEGGMFEVQAAQLASSKASSADVKNFAAKLADEHSTANKELMQLANDKKVDLPAGPPRSKGNEVEKLGKLSGKEFDEHFVREVGIKDHQTDIKKFEKASKDVKDPQLKAWIDKTLPHLRDHLAIAQKLPEAGKSGGTATSSGGINTGAAQQPKGGSAGMSKAGG
jgi:putative membrane protein